MREYCPQLLAISASVAGSLTKEDLLFYLSLIISVLTLIQKALDAREERRRASGSASRPTGNPDDTGKLGENQ